MGFLNPGMIVVALAMVVGLVALWQGDRALQRSKGASTAIEKVKKNNEAVARKADAAARKSADPDTPGVRNPNYRD